MRRLTSTTSPALRLWSPGMAAWQCLRRGQRNRCFGRLLWRLLFAMVFTVHPHTGNTMVIDEGILGDQHRTSIMDNNGICMNSKLITKLVQGKSKKYTSVHHCFYPWIPFHGVPEKKVPSKILGDSMISTSKVADVLTDVPPKRLDDPSQSPEIGCGSIGRLIYRTWSAKLLVADLLDAPSSYQTGSRVVRIRPSNLHEPREVAEDFLLKGWHAFQVIKGSATAQTAAGCHKPELIKCEQPGPKGICFPGSFSVLLLEPNIK